MLRHALRAVTLGSLAGLTFVLSVAPAFAAAASSGYGYYGPIGGYYYKNRADVDNTYGYIRAGTYDTTQNGGSVPAGYMGALARLYKGGALCSQYGYNYNGSTSSGIETYSSTGCGSGVYYSYGATANYNGNGYNYTYTFQSPSINN